MANSKIRFFITLSLLYLSVSVQGDVIIPSEEDFEYVSDHFVNSLGERAKVVFREVSAGQAKLSARDKSERLDVCFDQKRKYLQWNSKTYPGGDRYEGWLDNGKTRSGRGRYMFSNGDVFEGCWENSGGKGIGVSYSHPNNETYDDIYVSHWLGGAKYGMEIHIASGRLERHRFIKSSRDGSSIIRAIGDLSLLYNIKGQPIGRKDSAEVKRAVNQIILYDLDGSECGHSYFCTNMYGNRMELRVNYDLINKMANNNEISDFNDLIARGAIVGANSFSDLKPFAKMILEEYLYANGLLKREGGTEVLVKSNFREEAGIGLDYSQVSLLLLANVYGVEALGRIRFQKGGTLEREKPIRKESYRSIGSFMESLGIEWDSPALKNRKERYLVIPSIAGETEKHGINVILSLEKINLESGNKSYRGCSEDILYVHDPNREEQYRNREDYADIGGISKNIGGFMNRRTFGGLIADTCALHATAAAIVAAKNPDLIHGILDGNMKVYSAIDSGDGTEQSEFNEFELRTLLEIQELFDNLGLGKIYIEEFVKEMEKQFTEIGLEDEYREIIMEKIKNLNIIRAIMTEDDKIVVENMCIKSKSNGDWGILGDLACRLDEKLNP
jgi:hypothetical protein